MGGAYIYIFCMYYFFYHQVRRLSNKLYISDIRSCQISNSDLRANFHCPGICFRIQLVDPSKERILNFCSPCYNFLTKYCIAQIISIHQYDNALFWQHWANVRGLGQLGNLSIIEGIVLGNTLKVQNKSNGLNWIIKYSFSRAITVLRGLLQSWHIIVGAKKHLRSPSILLPFSLP